MPNILRNRREFTLALGVFMDGARDSGRLGRVMMQFNMVHMSEDDTTAMVQKCACL